MKTELSFDAICHRILIEEETPGKEALARWQKTYPKYRYAIAEFFADWAQEPEPAPEEDIELGPESLARIENQAAYAMDVLRRQGRVIPKDLVVKLKPFDQLVLTAVVDLGGRGDISGITEGLCELARRKILVASTIASLHRLENNKMLQARMANSETQPEKGGVRYFMATIAGERALAHAPATAIAVAEFQRESA